MTLVFAQYPLLWALLALATLLTLLAVRAKRGNILFTVLAVLCVVGMVIFALARSVPYVEILLLLLVPVIVCFLSIGKGERP